MFDLRSEQRSQRLGELQEYVHVPSGLTVLVARNPDPNRVIAVAARTAVSDAKGIPHALEHLLLAGSERYPSADPVADLESGSMLSYGNAFTRPDYTCFVGSSQSRKGFGHVTDVYLDGIFNPLLRPSSFHQHVGRMQDGRFIPGVVPNEIRAACGLPGQALTNALRQTLFPDHYYRYPAKGEIGAVANLSLAEVRNYYRTHYRPDGMLVFLYGDAETDQLLAKLDTLIDGRPPGAPAAGPVPRLAKPALGSVCYAAEADTQDGRFAAIGWAGQPADPQKQVSYWLLEQYLRSYGGPILFEAVASCLGGARIFGMGLIPYLALPVFQLLAKGGSRPYEREELATVVHGALRRTCSAGVPLEAAMATVSRLEFRLTENDESTVPAGLAWFLRILPAWRFGGDLLAALRLHRCLRRVAGRLDAGEPVIEDTIAELLVHNTHQACVCAVAVPERQEIPPDTAPPAPPGPAGFRGRVPVLGHDDLPSPSRVKPSVSVEREIRVVRSASPGEIAYVDLAFDLGGLTVDQLGLVPLLGAGLAEPATAARAVHVDRYTGGIRTRVLCTPGGRSFLVIRGKAMVRYAAVLAELMAETITQAAPAGAIVAGLARRERQKLYHALTGRPGGITVRALRQSPEGAATELLAGFAQLRQLAAAEADVRAGSQVIPAKFGEILRLILRSARCTLSWCGPGDGERAIGKITAGLSRRDVPDHSWAPVRTDSRSEIILTGTPSNAIATGVELPGRHGSRLVCAQLLNRELLWNQLRLHGGAYATGCVSHPDTSALAMFTHRDQSPTASIGIFLKAGRYLRHVRDRHDGTLWRYTVGVIGKLARVGTADEEALSQLSRVLRKAAPEDDLRLREEVLATSAKDCRDFGEILGLALSGSITVAATSDPGEVVRLRRALPGADLCDLTQ